MRINICTLITVNPAHSLGNLQALPTSHQRGSIGCQRIGTDPATCKRLNPCLRVQGDAR